MSLVNFFIWRKNNVSFWRYQDLCGFVKPAHFKFCDVIFWILSPLKVKFCQIVVCCMTKISHMFLAECWRLETSSRPFYDLIKMAIQQDLVIVNGWQMLFLIALYSPFQKNETLESCLFGYWVIRAGYWIKKNLEPSPSPPNYSKGYWILLP